MERPCPRATHRSVPFIKSALMFPIWAVEAMSVNLQLVVQEPLTHQSHLVLGFPETALPSKGPLTAPHPWRSHPTLGLLRATCQSPEHLPPGYSTLCSAHTAPDHQSGGRSRVGPF